MTIADGLIIAAVLLGPIVAVQAQKFLESRRDKKNRKVAVFKTLMATRGTPISPVHVEALNMIDVEFFGQGKGEKEIIERWKEYLDHLASCPKDRNDKAYDAKFTQWMSKNEDFLVNLLYEMGQTLGYKFDKVTLKKGVYVPRGHSELENDQYYLRKSLINVLLGYGAIPIEIKTKLKPPLPKTTGTEKP